MKYEVKDSQGQEVDYLDVGFKDGKPFRVTVRTGAGVGVVRSADEFSITEAKEEQEPVKRVKKNKSLKKQ